MSQSSGGLVSVYPAQVVMIEGRADGQHAGVAHLDSALGLGYSLTVDNRFGKQVSMTPGAVSVLIASPLEAEHARRIADADPRVRLLYAPDLLPVPRYPCDHSGTSRALSANDLARWSALRAAADVSFDFDWHAPELIAVNCPRLRWIQGTSAGIGGLLARTGLVDSPIVCTTAAGVHGVPLAEFALLGLLYFARDMPRLARDKRARRWERHATALLRGSRVLVVGLGGVGSEVARLLAAAGVEVYGASRRGGRCVPGVSRHLTSTQINGVLGEVDALVLACPLTDQTHRLIGRRELALLSPGAVLVNVSRGQVVDEDALAEALAEGRLRGACLDVFEAEPLPTTSPLWQLDNVIVSPHSASTVATENDHLTDLFIDNLGRWLAGEPLRNVFDKVAGY